MVAMGVKKEVVVAKSDDPTGKTEKKEKRRKAVEPEMEVISVAEESEGVKERKKKKNKQVPVKIEETHSDTANDTYNHNVKDVDGSVQETSKKKKNKKVLSGENGANDAEQNTVAHNSVGEEVAARKKKKKNKSVQSEYPVEDVKVEDGESLIAEEDVQKKVKKKTKKELNGNNVKEMNSIGQDTSKKKKKRLACEYDATVQADQNGGEVVKEERSEGKEQRKKKKTKKQHEQSEPPVDKIKVESGEEVGAEVKLLKKAKKEKKGQMVASTTCTEGTEDLTKSKKKGKKRSSELAEQGGEEEDTSAKNKITVKEELVPKVETEADEVETVKKKRRKEATRTKGEEPSEEAAIVEVKHKVKKKKKKNKEAETKEELESVPSEHNNNREEAIDGMDSIIHEGKQESKKKGLNKKIEEKKEQKEKKRKTPVLSETEGEPKKKRKKRDAVLSVTDEEVLDQPAEVCVEGRSGKLLTTVAAGVKKGKKERKTPPEVEIKLEKEVVEGDGKKRTKRKKIKVEHCDSEKQHDQEVDSHTDVVFLSKKQGNTDETTINQQRRFALQMEVDKASQPQTQPPSSGLGQWASAQFDSSEKQQKFLRLMGGFKKGAQPAGSIAGRANMALDKEAQDKLQQALLGEFEQAQSRRMNFNNKGSGLGFTAPSNKKFAIDVNARRSVQFDD